MSIGGNRVNIAQQLLERGAHLDQKVNISYTFAEWDNHINFLSTFVLFEQKGKAALICAREEGRHEIVSLLLKVYKRICSLYYCNGRIFFLSRLLVISYKFNYYCNCFKFAAPEVAFSSRLPDVSGHTVLPPCRPPSPSRLHVKVWLSIVWTSLILTCQQML